MESRLLLSIYGVALFAAACAQSDIGITTSVKSQLAADDLVQARRIDVDTPDRVVTLTGEVRSADEESQALQIARNTNGVRDVVDRISVMPEPGATPTTGVGGDPGTGIFGDAGITAAVKSKLLADPDTSGLRIDVDTKDGNVTGNVASQAEAREALDIARSVDAVKNVTDRLTVERRP